MTRVGLVLGAGGVVGHAFHGGALAAIAEVAGWDGRDAEIIVGTSAGSVVAALLRAGMSPGDLAAHAADQPLSPAGASISERARVGAASKPTPARPGPMSWTPAAPARFLRAALRPWEVRVGTLAAAALPAGRAPTDEIAASIHPLFGAAWPGAALWICAVRLDNGRRVVFGLDPAPPATVAQAVAASCAIPAWFAPVDIDGARYVDGGTYSPTNLDVLARRDLDTVIVSSPMSAVAGALPVSIDGAARAASRLRLYQEIAELRAGGTKVIAIEPDADDLRVMGGAADGMDPSRRNAVARRVHASVGDRLRGSDLGERLRKAL